MKKISIKLIVATLCFFNFNLQTMEPQSIDDIPEYCVAFAEQLFQQPELTRCGAYNHFGKVLFFQKWHDCKIFQLLNNWNLPRSPIQNVIECFGPHSPCCYHGTKILIDPRTYGILLTYKNSGYKSCSSEEMRKGYEKNIKQIQQNWVLPTQAEYQSLAHISPKQKYCLFIKTSAIKCLYQPEACVIRFLAQKFGLRDKIICDVFYPANQHSMLYLFIEQDALARFNKVFKFFSINLP